MEALNLLKYFKNTSLTSHSVSASALELNLTTSTQTDQNQHHFTNDEGPFFDFEFSVPLEAEEGEIEAEEAEMGSTETETEREVFNLVTDDDEHTDDDDVDDDQEQRLPMNPKSPQVKVSFLKSATKFRVFTLGLKRQKPSPVSTTEKQSSNADVGKSSFTLKFKVEEVPVVSLLTRENSSNANKSNKKQSSSEETEASKDALLQKYLKMIKPLYVKVSKRGLMGNKNSTEPIKISSTQDHQSSPTVKNFEEIQEGVSVKSPKQGNLQASLRVVCKHLGKSRSASSSAVAAAPTQVFVTRRLDDSLLQQQDGIQSAILHCKKSLNCDTSKKDSDSSQLLRSTSGPPRKTLDDGKGVDATVESGG